MTGEIPHQQRQLTLYAVERAAPAWDDVVAARLLELIAANPWQPPHEMHAGPKDPWQPFDRGRALAMFTAKRSLTLRTGEDLALDGSLATSANRNVLRLSMMPRVLDTRALGDVETYLASMLAALPQPAYGSASADTDQMVFKRERKLVRLPELIGSVGWLHVLCARAYPEYWDREVLLAAPCARVEERGDGSIWMWVYEHPLRYDTPEARDANAELSRYFAAHAKKPI